MSQKARSERTTENLRARDRKTPTETDGIPDEDIVLAENEIEVAFFAQLNLARVKPEYQAALVSMARNVAWHYGWNRATIRFVINISLDLDG